MANTESNSTPSKIEKQEALHFKVSTGLKRIIGRELITDDEVAIFELVKNSFDARSKSVSIIFEPSSISIIDNGDGMSLEDLKEKWLFVAFSSKRQPKRSQKNNSSRFRDQISERGRYAGSKGIGRFSSDRLGSSIILQTRGRRETGGTVHQLKVDWDLFEEDETKSFATIPITHVEQNAFQVPDGVQAPKHGTVIQIRNPRVNWDRQRILSLKASLAKLINPFGARSDGFSITLIANHENEQDLRIAESAESRGEEVPGHSIVNGPVGNFIFSTLQEKTTFIEVTVEKGGGKIVTALTDRGELVYRIREPQQFPSLSQSGFRCQLFYLNQAAKVTFTRRMGVPSVSFGSVFLFRNGFRVFPIGEEGDDWFGIDRRKQQGYARFLGTRDIIGRIDVSGDDADFQEASSRNQGLIETTAVKALKECFWEICLKRLERYVVPVTWADKGDKDTSDLSRVMTESGRARVQMAVAKLVDDSDIEVLEYSTNLMSLLNERSGHFEESLVNLRSIAMKTGDRSLIANLNRAEKRYSELRASEAEAIRLAEQERLAKEAAQAEAKAASEAAAAAEDSLEEERKRSLFLVSLTSLDSQTILNMHHQITIYAADIKQQIDNCIAAASRGKSMNLAELTQRLEQIAFLNQKVLSVSKLATKANFRLESDMISADIADFIEQYVKEGAIPFISGGMQVIVENKGSGIEMRFRPMEVAVVVDNLISNARKARASRITFVLKKSDKNTLLMEVDDNGTGFPKDVADLDSLFGLGVSRTSGSGLGLYHVRQVLGELGGSVTASRGTSGGGTFFIRISK